MEIKKNMYLKREPYAERAFASRMIDGINRVLTGEPPIISARNLNIAVRCFKEALIYERKSDWDYNIHIKNQFAHRHVVSLGQKSLPEIFPKRELWARGDVESIDLLLNTVETLKKPSRKLTPEEQENLKRLKRFYEQQKEEVAKNPWNRISDVDDI